MKTMMQWSAAMACIAATYAGSALAVYPEKPITVITPLAAASAVDNTARLIAQEMSKILGQSLVVENAPGAAGIIGANRVATAAPDGYTIGAFNDSILTMVPNLQSNVPWDPIKDFAPISLVSELDWGLVSTPGVPYKTAGDLIAAAKAAPGKIEYASGGNGSPQHIAMALFASINHLNMVHVPYKGASPAAIGVAAGEAKVGFSAISTVKTLVDGKKLTLMGVSADNRLDNLPGVPTISESGSPGFVFNSWFVLVAPAKTPKPIIDRLYQAVKTALANPEVQAKLAAQGAAATGSTPEELGRRTRESYDRYKKLIKDNGIQAD